MEPRLAFARRGGVTNPRIVEGKKDGEILFAARGHIGDESFRLCILRGALQRYPRGRMEDRLLEEATSLIREAGRENFDWASHHFELDEEFGVWEKTLSAAELEHLMRE